MFDCFTFAVYNRGGREQTNSIRDPFFEDTNSISPNRNRWSQSDEFDDESRERATPVPKPRPQPSNRDGNRGNGGGGGGGVGGGQCRTSFGVAGQCKPIVSCYGHMGNLATVQRNLCPTTVNGHKTQGVCCPREEVQEGSFRVPYTYDPPPFPQLDLNIPQGAVARAVDVTEDRLLRFLEMEVGFLRQGYSQQRNTMESFHQAVFGPPNLNLQTLNLNGFRALEVTRAIGRRSV